MADARKYPQLKGGLFWRQDWRDVPAAKGRPLLEAGLASRLGVGGTCPRPLWPFLFLVLSCPRRRGSQVQVQVCAPWRQRPDSTPSSSFCVMLAVELTERSLDLEGS